MGPRLATTNQRFWKKVRVGGPDECWPWLGGKGHFGHGKFYDGGRRRPAHQVAFELHHGRPVTPGLFVLHDCDNPPCCNPAHLYEGTQADNMRDRDVRGRTGRGHRMAARPKLTHEQVILIRAAYVRWKVTQDDLAKQFGVSRSAIGKILRREAWRD